MLNFQSNSWKHPFSLSLSACVALNLLCQCQRRPLLSNDCSSLMSRRSKTLVRVDPHLCRRSVAHLPYGSREEMKTLSDTKRWNGKSALIERIKLRERTRTRAVCLSSKPVQVRWMNNSEKTHECAHQRIGCPRREETNPSCGTAVSNTCHE